MQSAALFKRSIKLTRLPIHLLGLTVACATSLPLQADELSSTGAQGPSVRAVASARSAYSPSAPQLSSPAATPAQNTRSEASNPSGRTPRFKTVKHSSGELATNSTKRGVDLLGNWARGSGATAAAALAFVVGLFMLLAWAVKRGMPKSDQLLPAEAVRLLGRVPLGSRQFGHLLQLGNKLVLISVNQTGVEKLAEIDDPQEVVRLLSLSPASGGSASQEEFEQVFGQFAKEKTEPGLLGSEVSLFGSDQGHTFPQTGGGRRYA